MKSQSIARGLVLWLGLSVAAFWAVAAGLGAAVMYDEFGEIFDSSMQRTAERLMPLVLDYLQHNQPSAAPRRLQKSDGAADEYLTYQVRDVSGKVLVHSHDTAATPFNAPLKRGFWQDDTSRVFTTAAPDDKTFVQVADRLAHRMEATQEGALALLLPLLVLIPLSVITTLLIVRRATAPVIRLRRAISAKDGGNLSAIRLGGLPVELQPIANSINLLLARLQAALGAEREFTANSAHELRTPIAGAIAQTQMLIGQLNEPATRSRALLVEQSLQRLSALTEKLLQLSRAEAGIGLSETSRDLIPLILMVVEDFNRSAGSNAEIRFVCEPGASLQLAVNQDAFAIVLRNLIENALVHGEKDWPIDIRVVGNGRIIVSNRARYLAPLALEQVRKRFARGDQLSRGSGLGLSIVDRLLAQMNATLSLVSEADGDGYVFKAVVSFDRQ